MFGIRFLDFSEFCASVWVGGVRVWEWVHWRILYGLLHWEDAVGQMHHCISFQPLPVLEDKLIPACLSELLVRCFKFL